MQGHPPVRLPRLVSVASSPSGLASTMSPSLVANRTSVMPGPPESSRWNPVPRQSASQAAIRSAVGLFFSAVTDPPLTVPCGWSSVAASSDRHEVARVQLRSVSPGW